MRNLINRTISGALMLMFLGLMIYMGDPYLGITLMVLSIIGLYEWSRALGTRFDVEFFLLGLVAVGIFLEKYILGSTILIPTIGIFLLFIRFLLTDMDIADVAIGGLGLVYIARSFFLLWDIQNPYYIVLVFLIAFGTDTCAYIVGMTIGKHKLAPTISPNKSIEGAVGGVIGSVLISTMYLRYFDMLKGSVPVAIIVLAITSVISQSGDLFASKIKRELDVKDYGNLIPGHGGILDRFDSVLFVAPIIYTYFNYL